MIDPDRLRDALAEARERVDEAALRSGRPAGSVQIVMAGKYVPADQAPALVAAGVGVVGENRLQDLLAKRAVVGDGLVFDFIGHLQRRKARDVLPVVRLIHTLDSEALAAEIARRAEGPVRLLVEINVADEPTKHGIPPSDLDAFVDLVSERHPELVIGGLMTLPPHQAAGPEGSRAHFARVRDLAERLRDRWSPRHDLADLSMGTTQDFVVAAEEGASMVRIGRGLIERSQVG
ncbi:MAG: YggS family pyridoxal phosphate enzyme [Thermoleophilia bacterium]|nr:YggS family pyridoxal phosphate enzyme [Thermoleophilia bacterium]